MELASVIPVGDFFLLSPRANGLEIPASLISLSPQPWRSTDVFSVLSAALRPSLQSAQTSPFSPRFLEGLLIVFYFSLSQNPSPELPDQGSQ